MLESVYRIDSGLPTSGFMLTWLWSVSRKKYEHNSFFFECILLTCTVPDPQVFYSLINPISTQLFLLNKQFGVGHGWSINIRRPHVLCATQKSRFVHQPEGIRRPSRPFLPGYCLVFCLVLFHWSNDNLLLIFCGF